MVSTTVAGACRSDRIAPRHRTNTLSYPLSSPYRLPWTCPAPSRTPHTSRRGERDKEVGQQLTPTGGGPRVGPAPCTVHTHVTDSRP